MSNIQVRDDATLVGGRHSKKAGVVRHQLRGSIIRVWRCLKHRGEWGNKDRP